MESNKKILLTTIGIAILVVTLVGITYSFFNYTRTGLANNIRVGRIYFNTSENGSINLTNVFPIKSEDLDTDQGNHDSVTISITGDTTYSEGVEYLVTFTDTNILVNNKRIPVAFEVESTNIGTSSNDYYNDRGGNTSYYLLTEEGKVAEEKYILVGYIAPGQTGINESITITSYVDGDKIAITDTYDGLEGDDAGTTTDWVDGRTVFTTTEWNSLVFNGISFKVKVEANEGIWVEEEATPSSCFTSTINIESEYNTNRTNDDIANCVTLLTNWGFDGDVGENEDLGSFCAGTGTIDGDMTFEDSLDNGWYSNFQLIELENINIINNTIGGTITGYDVSCGKDVVIPKKLNSTMTETRVIYNVNRSTDNINSCVSLLEDWWGPESTFEDPNNNIWATIEEGESYYDYCAGTGTNFGETLPPAIKWGWFPDSVIEDFKDINIVTTTSQTVSYDVNITKIGGSCHDDGNFANGPFVNLGLTSVVIPNSITDMGVCTFSDNNLTSVKIPNSITKIPLGAFQHNNLASIQIPSNITEIGFAAFRHNSLTSIEIPSTVQTIGQYAFASNSIDNLVIPETLTSTGNYSFINNQLTNVTIEKAGNVSSQSLAMNSNLTIISINKGWIERNYFNNIGVSSLTTVIIGSDVESISNSAFYNNNNINNITIDKSCSAIKSMSGYPWGQNKAGVTIYGSNNEICDSW